MVASRETTKHENNGNMITLPVGDSVLEKTLQIRNLIEESYIKFTPYKSPEDILIKSIPMDIMRVHHKISNIMARNGLLWERIFCLFGYEKLPKGGDIINHDKKVVIELKNSKSSDCKSGRKENLNKLKQSAPQGYQLIYGIINDKKPKDEDIEYEGTSYKLLTGKLLLEFRLGDKWEYIINIIKQEFNAIVQFT